MTKDLSPRLDIPSFWRTENRNKISLHLGEYCYPPTQRVVDAIAESAQYANRYPDTNSLELRKELAAYVGNGVTHNNIIVGNGSDELIDLATLTFTSQSSGSATFSPTFFVYNFAAQRHAHHCTSITRAADYTLPAIDSLPNDVPDQKPAITFIANPNNPTGTLTPRTRLIEYLEGWPGIVVVDECYFEYCQQTIVDLIHDYENLIVLRSLSKSFGLSGLRIGYAIAANGLIDSMERHALTFPVNICAQAAAIAALKDIDVYQQRIQLLIRRRDSLKNTLEQMGLDVLPSSTNFLLTLWPVQWNDNNPAKVLAARGILVSDQTSTLQAGRPALRIAVGTAEEIDYLKKVLNDMLS